MFGFQVDASVSVMVDVQNTLVNNVFSFYANDDVKSWAFPKLAQDTVRAHVPTCHMPHRATYALLPSVGARTVHTCGCIDCAVVAVCRASHAVPSSVASCPLPSSGPQLGCFCLSEPNAGSDAFALTTRAEDKGDHWLINGNKMWITNSGEAGLFLVRAPQTPTTCTPHRRTPDPPRASDQRTMLLGGCCCGGSTDLRYRGRV